MNGLRMHDGWPYVAAAYASTAAVFGVWFWMIGAKLAKLRRQTRARTQAPSAPTKAGIDG